MTKYRLILTNDSVSEDSFICECSDFVFARINKIAGKWVCWIYPYHIQKTFSKVKEAIIYINSRFIEYIRK